MKKSKLLCLALAAASIVTIASGCKEKKTSTNAENVTLTGVNEFPVVKEKVEFSVFVPKSSFVSDFETNEFTKWYEEKTNVHINWSVSSGDAQQAFNLMIASGEYPDIILGMGLSREQVSSLAKQGIVVDISKEIDKYGYYTKRMFEKEPTAKEYVMFGDKIYGIPRVSATYASRYKLAMWVYRPWMEKLGIEEPQTTEEFYQMLKAFKEKDPNGNGKADEIPLAARGVYNWGTGIEAFLMSAFIPDDASGRYYVDNGQVKYAGVQPEYRDGLRYIKKLYDEGLIYRDTFILDRNQITALGENETPILGAAPGEYPGMFCNPTGTTKRYHEFTTIPPLKGPGGVRATVPTSSVANGHSFIVTKTCKHPDVAVKWVDWLMSEEGKIKSQDRGLTITRKAKDGELGVDGRQALWTIEQKSAEEQAKYSEGMQNLAWYNSGIYYSSLESSLRTCDPENKSAELYKLYSTYDKYGTDKYKQITIADEDIDAYTDYQSIKDETEASFAKFVTGEYDLDKDWDKYVAGLNNLGLKEYMKLLQRNYDAVK